MALQAIKGSESDKHYRVEVRIDGIWQHNSFVFASSSEAESYGQEMLDTIGADKFRLIVTGDPVKLPWTE